MMFLWLLWGLTTTQNIISLKAQDRIWIVSRLTDTRSAENDWIGAETDPQYRIDASLVKSGAEVYKQDPHISPWSVQMLQNKVQSHVDCIIHRLAL